MQDAYLITLSYPADTVVVALAVCDRDFQATTLGQSGLRTSSRNSGRQGNHRLWQHKGRLEPLRYSYEKRVFIFSVTVGSSAVH